MGRFDRRDPPPDCLGCRHALSAALLARGEALREFGDHGHQLLAPIVADLALERPLTLFNQYATEVLGLDRSGGAAIRRRRECESCGKRFTTHERVEEILPLVLKKDGRREPFDRLKVIAGIQKACEKRPVSVETIERLLDKLETRLQEGNEREIASSLIGEWVMNELHDIDEVAYVRFASVYRNFREAKDFEDFVEKLSGGRDER